MEAFQKQIPFNDGSEPMQCKNTRSHKLKLELTTFGYVRSNYKDEIPDDITRVCLEYYDTMEISWDVFRSHLSDLVSVDGLTVTIARKPDNYATFASSIGWNEGVHTFTIKQSDSSGNYCGIGIISSDDIPTIGGLNDVKEDYFLYTQNKEAIGYCLDYVTVWKIKDAGYDDILDTRIDEQGPNDAVTMMVDCDKWKATFYINNKICNKSFDIEKDRTYHAVFTVWSSAQNISYQLIETTAMDIDSTKTV